MKKKAYIPLLCHTTFLHLRMLIVFDLQKKKSDFLFAVAIQAGQNFQSNLRGKQIIVIFNMLQNVDEISI